MFSNTTLLSYPNIDLGFTRWVKLTRNWYVCIKSLAGQFYGELTGSANANFKLNRIHTMKCKLYPNQSTGTNLIGMQFILLAFILFAAFPALAQDVTVTGKVIDDTKVGLPGVSVVIKGSSGSGTITDFDGNYTIKVDSKATLLFSFVGYKEQEIAVNGQTTINLTMSNDNIMLQEAVVVGYGTQKKKEVANAVVSVKSEEIVQVAASDFTKALQGKVAGVNITESSGRPGDNANIQIRGLGSINGTSAPLYVVDGIPYNSNPNIASEDIASVDILKDGAAAAIYGTRAANGVILITTKRGKVGETKVQYSGYYGIQNITSHMPLLNTPEHLYVDEMMAISSGDRSQILAYNPDAMDYNTDFVGALTNNNAAMQNHSISLSGGQENLTFNLSSNYFSQDGILIKSGYERFNTRANATFKKGKFEAFVSLGIQNTTKEQEPWGLYEFSIFQGPYRKPIDSYASSGSAVTIDGGNPDHVSYLSRLLTQDDIRKDKSYNLAANLKYEIIDGLKYQVNIGSNYWNHERNFWQPQYLVYNQQGEINELGSRRDAILLKDKQSSNKLTLENIISYDKEFGKHKLGLIAGYTIEKTNFYSESYEKRNFISNNVQVFDGGSDITIMKGSEREQAIIGKLFRVQYSYDSRYLLSASVRYDGSSNFGPDYRYQAFPGISLGWNVSEESFMKDVDFITNLKLRGSYGEVGNQGIPPYLYDAYIDANIDYIWGGESSDELGLGAIQRGYANNQVKWETNVTRNVGFDLLMFEGKFSLAVDLYKNTKRDMLLNVLLPPSTGTHVLNDWSNTYNSKMTNIGNMTNQGIEIATYYKERTKFGLNWQVTATFTKNINEVTDLGSLESIPLAASVPAGWRAVQQDITAYMMPGYQAGAFFLIPTDGIIKTQEELDVVKGYMPNAQLGDVKYIDTDGNGTINDDDRQYAGSAMPDFEASLILSADYKGFDASVQLFGSYGNKVFNGAKLFAYAMKRHKDLYYMWTPQNADSDIPAARQNSEHNNTRARSDYFLEDGSYIRVRNASVGYTFSKEMLKGKIDKVRLYLTAQNPFTFTKYDGYDPEIGGNGVTTRGIDKGNYPISRKFMAGIQIDF